MVETLRQGDVLVIRIDALPNKKLTPVPKRDGRIILADGEVTGHAHAVVSDGATLLELVEEGQPDKRFLDIKDDTEAVHEEHGTIPLKKGYYEVRRQREYQPDEIRQVAD